MSTTNIKCAGCNKHIIAKHLLQALDLYWHEECLKCGCCDCRLGEVGNSLYIKGNLLLCRRDYLRLFGLTGYCAACNKMIAAFEMVMRAKSHVYHLDCFACQKCEYRFYVGEEFFLVDGLILCKKDYSCHLQGLHAQRLEPGDGAGEQHYYGHNKPRETEVLATDPKSSDALSLPPHASRGKVDDSPDREAASHVDREHDDNSNYQFRVQGQMMLMSGGCMESEYGGGGSQDLQRNDPQRHGRDLDDDDDNYVTCIKL